MKLWSRCIGIAVVALIAQFVAVGSARAEFLKKTFERTYKVTGPAQLHIETGSGDVIVRRGQSGTVHVKGTIHLTGSIFGSPIEAEHKADEIVSNPPIEQDGNLIRIGKGKGTDEGGSLLFPKYVSIDYEIETPADTQIESKTGSGDYQISGLKGPVTLESGSGDIKIEDIVGKVRVKTGSGDVVMDNSGADGIEVETGSGDVALRLPAKAGYELTAHTGSGDIDLTPGLGDSVTVHENEAHGKINSGTHPLDLRTGSGDIKIE